MRDIKSSIDILYNEHITRNIGLISNEEQEKIRHTPVAIFGLGGLGGSVIEQLVRVGCENVVICDNDKFDKSNLNRQICSTHDIGKYKLDVIKDLILGINPRIKITSFKDVSQQNLEEKLNEVKITALTLDDPCASIKIARYCRKNKIDLIESYGIPYLWVWWFTNQNIDYETCYNLDTKGFTSEELDANENLNKMFYQSVITKLLKFPKISLIYDRQQGVLKEILEGKRPLVSLAPIVRITASYIAFEIIYSGILDIKKKILAPNIIGYDYYHMNPINLQI